SQLDFGVSFELPKYLVLMNKKDGLKSLENLFTKYRRNTEKISDDDIEQFVYFTNKIDEKYQVNSKVDEFIQNLEKNIIYDFLMHHPDTFNDSVLRQQVEDPKISKEQ